jgi:hypothetical protein
MKFRVGAILAGAAMMVAAASPTYAQGPAFGVKAGVTFADLSIEPGEDEDEDELADILGNKTGFVVGGFVEVPVAPQFSLAPEVLFVQKGAKGDVGSGSVTLTADQIQVPVLLKANLSAGSVRPFVTVGPAFGFKVSSKFKVEGVAGEADFEEDNDDIEPVEFSLVFGGGVKFGKASVEARYDLGLNDLVEDEGEAKTRTFSILFGYAF